jgi:hypothetical protein
MFSFSVHLFFAAITQFLLIVELKILPNTHSGSAGVDVSMNQLVETQPSQFSKVDTGDLGHF